MSSPALDLLRETDSRYRCLVEDSLCGVYILQDEKLVYVNPKFAEIFGYTPEEMLALDSALKVVVPEDRPLGRENIRKRVDGEAKGLTYTIRGLRKDGSVIALEVHGSRTEYEGRPAAIGTIIDVTDRQRAEKALRESEARKAAMLESSLDAAITIDHEGKILEFNPAAERIFGYDSALAVGRHMADLIVPPAQRAAYRRGLARCLETGECPFLDRRVELTAVRADGAEFPVELVVTRIPLDGPPIFTGFVRDITESRKAQEQLRESEARFRALAEASSVGVFIYQGTRFRYVNPAVVKLTGYAPDELLAMEPWQVAHPEFRAFARERVFARQRGEPIASRYEMKILTKGGEERWINLSAALFLFEGRPAVVGAAFDVTERKQAEEALRVSEERYRRIVDAANEGIWMLDSEGRIEFLNRRMAEMFGYSREQMLGRSVSEFMDEEMRAEAGRHLELCHQGIFQKFDFPFRRADGSRLWGFVSCTPIPTGSGHFGRALAMVVDVTDRRLAEEGLKESERRLRALLSRLVSVREEERTRMAQEIHDELGQTLTGIKLDLSWLRGRCQGPLAAARPELESRIDSTMLLVDSTVETVRRLATELRPVVLDSLGLKAALQWQAGEFQKRTGLPCAFRCRGEQFPLERGRSTAVFRIFQEALTNVARHAQARAVAVTLAREGEDCLLTVEDDGVGIPPEKIGDACSLGLLGMRERARAFGGSVAVGAAPAGGTRIEVRIPLVETVEASR